MSTVNVHCVTTRLGDYAFRTQDEASAFAARGAKDGFPATKAIAEMTVTLPDGALWHGDVISAEVLHGQQSDEDGMNFGGRWTPVVGYIVPTRGVTLRDGKVTGIWADIVELGTERVVGVLDAAVPDQAAAVRRISIVRRRDAQAGSL